VEFLQGPGEPLVVQGIGIRSSAFQLPDRLDRERRRYAFSLLEQVCPHALICFLNAFERKEGAEKGNSQEKQKSPLFQKTTSARFVCRSWGGVHVSDIVLFELVARDSRFPDSRKIPAQERHGRVRRWIKDSDICLSPYTQCMHRVAACVDGRAE